jgi:transcriptional regulator with XRE-family HTH domain
MRYDGLRAPLRRARQSMGLTQAALAERSGASRVTIARLESGSAPDARLSTVVGVCEALSLELRALPLGALEALETRLARGREASERVERRRAHAALAARLLGARGEDAAALVRRARAVVDRWEREGLCSLHYVVRWRALLEGGPREVARAILDPGEWRDALYQNTPWSFALEREAA